MRKSKTILDFFGKSPSNNSKSPSNILKESPKEKISVKVTGTKTPRSDRKTKDSTGESDIDSKENASTPKTDSSTKTKRKIFSAEKDKGVVSGSPVSPNEECDTPKQAKRRRIVVESDSDDSADDYKPGKESESDDSMSEASAVSETETPEKKVKTTDKKIKIPSFDAYNKDSPSNTPKVTNGSSPASFKTSNGFESPNASFNSSFSNVASPRLSSHKSADASNQNKEASANKIRYLHERLDWLMSQNIKDKCGRRSSHPDYDPTTLYVPESFKKTLTPGMKQWWDIKTDCFDTVLFFKVGKFYEFYHMDAAICVKELDLSFMKGDFAHSGFPEVAFGKFSDILIHKGYKIARIEQTETPQMMEQRCKKLYQTTKYDKVVKREICQVTSKGTRTSSYEEWCNNIGPNNNFLLAICEKHVEQEASATEYGICFVDTTIGKFTLGQFFDDRHKSRLLSFIGLYPPVEILFEKSSVSQKTLRLFENNLAGISMQALSSGSFWDGTKTLKFMAENGCCKEVGEDVQWPEEILQMLDKDDTLYQTPAKEYELGFKAFGACIWYLKSCLIEDCLLTMKLFDVYKPIDGTENSQAASKKQYKYMILDNVTLHNLAIIPSQSSSRAGETLYGTLNYCETSFGKRELRKWLCSPLFQSAEIYDRLNAIDDLKNISSFDDARKILRKLPDLERLLNKIHIHGLARSKVHPESRAIFYEMEIYNKKKIADLLSALEGFKESVNICALFEPHISDFNSNILKNCFSAMEGNDNNSKIKEVLSFFSEAFDHQKAIKQGSIIPYPGVDDNYDSACKKIQDTLEELDSYRDKQSRKLNCQAKFVKNGKNRYLLEVPENKNIPSEYEFQGGRKGFKRFYTKEIKELLSELTSFEEARDSALRDTTRHIFEQFDKHYAMWEKTVQCLSTLDVLLSLTNYCKITVGKMCKPEFLTEEDNSEPHLEIIEGRHPLFEKYCPNKDYISNSIYIGKKNDSENINKGGKVILVTGPNMGGKSTLMRQTGILLIMAQIGCYVPAESMVLTPVDRVFTRVGANDQIYKGESTFFVESNETASILQHATHRSFVLIDELGRGTATYDGTAIAYSTAKYIANEIGCRTLFSTHYHSLVEDFRDDPNVGLGHMACMVEKDSDCSVLEKVTFLYKFVDGACPKSYGFNVALLAGIDKMIVHKGFLKSQQIDYGSRISKCLRKLLTIKSSKEIIGVLGEKLSDVLNI